MTHCLQIFDFIHFIEPCLLIVSYFEIRDYVPLVGVPFFKYVLCFYQLCLSAFNVGNLQGIERFLIVNFVHLLCIHILWNWCLFYAICSGKSA
ncbi:hypothetical protein MtrunA17_Chr6g0475841 [Medicago truncatula]|uniref:Transmembrane protein n=1 Tax=Medicago truncatula TaxID=3880 RepID=A0A396HFC2_MEDTR|nr:hypothetical protein MtrunA17_Chr6g0475841 [Medicago truncatula]